ncbi:uncharacterized protein [Choristoneura fumiferana]|uniref:uncharacterized protein n=1 Tax=Choristoneura fumiferana TaxID=7141 RepID=UPI003D15CC68
MKTPPDVPGTTRTCSFISCFCDSLSCKHSLLRRILYLRSEGSRKSGKDLTRRERKLLSKLIAEYDKVKSEILSVNRNEQQKIDALQRNTSQANRKGTEDTESAGAMLELVKLVDKSQALGHNELSECCSCCICNSSICSFYKRQRHRHSHMGRTNYTSKSSLSRHNRSLSERALRLKEKTVCSDPCTCTTKLSSAITIESKRNNTLMQLNKLQSMDTNGTDVDQKMDLNRPITKHLKHSIVHSELSKNRRLRGSMKSFNRKIRGEVKRPFKTITVLIKETKSKLKESLLKKDEIVKSNIQVEERVGDSYKEILGNTNLLTSGEQVINTKLDSNSETIAELMQVPKTRIKTSIRPENRGSYFNLSKNSEYKQKQEDQRPCQQKLLAKPSQDSKIRSRKNMKSRYGKVQTKGKETKYWPSHLTYSSEESTSQNCYNLLSLRKARLAETLRFSNWNIKEIIEKSLSDLGTQLEVIQPVIKSKFSTKIGTMTSITDISKIFLDIEGKKVVKSSTVGICNQPTLDLKEGTKNKVLPNNIMGPGTLKPAENANIESLVKVKKSNKKLDKKYNNPKQESNHKKLELLTTVQQDQSVALSENIDFKSTSKSLLLSSNYSQFSFKSLNSITVSGLKINLLNQSSITSSYVPQCLCITNTKAPLKDSYYNGHSNDLDACKVSISACKILTIEKQSVSKFSDKTKELVSSVSAKSSLNNKTEESHVQANTMLGSTFKTSPFANVQTVYQCQPVKCPNIVAKPKRSKICHVPHKCESHMSVPIECDPNKCLKVVTKRVLKCESYSSQSLREAISTLNIACPCKCQKCQVALPPDTHCQRRKTKEKFKKLQSKCPDRCLTLTPKIHQCQKKKVDKKNKKSQLKCPDKRCRASTISSCSDKRDLSVCESQMFIPINCNPSKCLKVVTKNALKSKSRSNQSLRQAISALNIACPCKCQKCQVANKKLKQSQSTCSVRCAPLLEIKRQEQKLDKKLKKMQSKCSDKCLASPFKIQCPKKKSDKKFKKTISKCLDKHCPTSTAISTSQSEENQCIAGISSISSPQGIRLSCSPRPSPCPVQCDPKTTGLLATTTLFIRRCFCKQKLKENKEIQQQMLKCKKKHSKENKVKLTSKTFECGDRNSVSSLNQSCDSTMKQKSSKKSKATNFVYDNKYPKELLCKPASRKQGIKVSNYSFRVEYCRSPCPLSDKNAPGNHASSECKWELITPRTSPVFSITCKPSKTPCFECESISKEYIKKKPCKKKKSDKSSSSEICVNLKPKPVQCPAVKCKKPQKPQNSITVLTVCKEKKTCPSVKSKTKRTSKKKTNCTQKHQASCQLMKCDYKHCMCKPPKCSTSKQSKGSSIECKIKLSESHKSVKVGKDKAKAKCCSSKECECKQIDPHKSISDCKSCKLQIKCMPLKSERQSTKTDRSVTVCNVKEYKCRPLVKCECKPHENVSICQNCKLQMNRTSLICKCKTTECHKCVAACKDKKQIKCECKPIEPHKSSSTCKYCKSNKKTKCECVKPHKSVLVCKKCTPLICECKSIEPDKCRTVCKKNVECGLKDIKPPKKTSVCKKSNSNKKTKCQLLECEMKQFKHCTPLVCECESVCKKCKGEKQAKCQPLKSECKYIEHYKIVTIGKKDKKQIMYCPSVDCECEPPVRCKNKSLSRAQQQKCCQPLECECFSYMADCCKDKKSKKSQIPPQDEDITSIRQFINAGILFLTRYFKPETEKDEIENHKKKKVKTKRPKAKKYDNVCPHCGHTTKASQTSGKKTKASSKKNQAKQHRTEEVNRMCKHNKVKSCSAPRQQMLCSGSKSCSCLKPQKHKRRQCEHKTKLSHKNNKCMYDIETENNGIKAFIMNFFRKNNKCTTTAENKNIQCPKAKMSTKGNKLATKPSHACIYKAKKSKKKLKKCVSRGDTVSKKSNATTSTCYSVSTQCSKKPANKIKCAHCEHKKPKYTPKACKQKGCHSNIGDTGPIVKHCYCSSKSCKNASKHNCSNCHQVYYVETQPNWNKCHKPLFKNVPYEFEPSFCISSQYNRDVNLQKTICSDMENMHKSPSQMEDVKTKTKYSAVGRALMRRLCNLEIQTTDSQVPSPNKTTIGRVPIDVDRRNCQQKRHLPTMQAHKLVLSAPNEISTIYPYTPKKKLKRKGLAKNEVSQNLNYKQEIGQSPETGINCKSQRHENYDGLKQKQKHIAKRKIKMSKHISSRGTYNVDQVKVTVQKQPISSGITRIKNICVSLFTRQKKTAPKPNMSKCQDDCKDKLYQTVSLKIPCNKRCCLVASVICTSSKSDSQPKKQVIVRTKKTKSITNPKILKHKVGTKYYDLISNQQIESCPQYQSGDTNEQVLNVPNICINNKYPDTVCQKEILSYFCKPQFDTEKGFSPYARDYTVGYAFRSRKQKHNYHHPCTSGVQSSSRGLFKNTKSETEDRDCNARSTNLKIKGILKKKPKSLSCCDVCCGHKKRTNSPERGKERSSIYHERNEIRSNSAERRKFNKKLKTSSFRHQITNTLERGRKGGFTNDKANERSRSNSSKRRKLKKKHKISRFYHRMTNAPEKRRERGFGYHEENESSTSNSAKRPKFNKKHKMSRSYHQIEDTPERERSSVHHEKYGSIRSRSLIKRKSKKKHKGSKGYYHRNEKSTSKSAGKRKLNKKHKTSRAVGPKPCDSTCLVNLTREGRLEKPKPKMQKPLRFRKTCRDDCKHMKHLERVKIKKEEKKIKEARSQTKKLTSRSPSSFLRSITNSLVVGFAGKSKTSVPQKKNDAPPTPLFEIHIDSKDYRVLNREQTIYSISEWQRKEMERRTAEARHGKACRCCICVRSALQQSSHTRKTNAKTDMILKNPSIVECVCGSAVCDKERKKMIDQLEQEISKQQAQQKPCVCGSKICAREAEIASHKKVSKVTGKGRGKGKGKIKEKKKKKKKVKEKKDKKHKKDKHKKEKEKREEKERRKMEKLKEKRERKKKKPDKDKRRKEIEKAQEKLQRKEEKKKEKLEREKEKKEMKKPKKPKKTARELLDEKMKKFSDARKKDYENWQKSREFKRDNKYEVAARERHKYYVAKMNRLESNATQERSEPDMQLIAKSIADLWDVSATCVQSAARQTYRRIMQPEPTDKHIKRQDFKTNQFVIRTTFRNIQRRLLLTKIFGFIGKLGGTSNRYRRKRKSPENWGCNMYMQTLRVKRCVWLYKTCPWFYPYCLNIITVWRHFAFFVLFFIGAILWTPCFFCVELCNLLLCCHC